MAASIAFPHLSSLPVLHRALISSSASHGNSRLPVSSRPLRLAASPSLHSAAADVESVVNPASAHANLMFFNSAYNVQIMVDEGEPEEVLLRRFRREVSKAGVIQECKRRRFFENKQEEKKRKAREAGRRNRRRYLLFIVRSIVKSIYYQLSMPTSVFQSTTTFY